MTGWLTAVLVLFVVSLIHASALEGWRKRIVDGPKLSAVTDDPMPDTFVSLIVPARNAADTLVPLLQDLHAQRYTKERCEVIVVDDHSEDDTAAIVMGMGRTWSQLRLVTAAEGTGKKNAITKGVAEAKGELIMLTDADTRCGPDRLRALADHWHSSHADLVLMPVATKGGDGLLATLQREEQLALQGATAGSALDGMPTLANGANMAFTREIFFAVNGFQGDHWASGDDMLLLKRALSAGRKVSYLLDPAAVVTAAPELNVQGFVAQRLRWAGKMRAYRNTSGFVAGLFALLMPWALLVVTVGVARNVSVGESALYTWALLIGAWLAWSLPVLRLANSMRTFFATNDDGQSPGTNVLRTALALIAFVIYALVIAIVSLFVRPTWKGRPI